MPTFSAIVSIRASREQVWAILTDVEGYRRWNRTFPRISGAVRPGAQLSAHASGAGTSAYRITVEEYLPETKMVWCGTSTLGWTRRQTFAVRPVADGLVEFKIQEEHKGLLCAWWVGERRERQAQLDRFAVSLKQRVEALSPELARNTAHAKSTLRPSPELQLVDNSSLQNLSLATAFYSSTIEMGYPNLREQVAEPAPAVPGQKEQAEALEAAAAAERTERSRGKCQSRPSREPLGDPDNSRGPSRFSRSGRR